LFTSTIGIKILGVHTSDFGGSSVAISSDLNGDRTNDMLIGKYFDSLAGNTAIKYAYVVFRQRKGLNNVNFNTVTYQQGYTIQGYTIL